MKTIVNCEKNREYVVKKLHTKGALRQRLVSFGLLKGTKIKYLASTSLKETYEIQIGKTNVSLRKSEASAIEVES